MPLEPGVGDIKVVEVDIKMEKALYNVRGSLKYLIAPLISILASRPNGLLNNILNLRIKENIIYLRKRSVYLYGVHTSIS